MRLLHGLAKIHVMFDDPNLVSRAGLVPVMALAQRADLAGLAGEQVRIGRRCGVNAQVKVPAIVAGMIGGADSIDDLDLLRHGAMPVAVWRDPGAVHAGVVPAVVHLGERAPAGEGEPAAAGRAGPPRPAAARQGCAGLPGHRLAAKTGLRPQEAGGGVRPHQDPGQEPAGTRAERAGRHHQHAAGRTGDRRHPAARRQRRLRARRRVVRHEAVHTARATGCTGTLVVRADSAFYSAAFTARCARPGRSSRSPCR